MSARRKNRTGTPAFLASARERTALTLAEVNRRVESRLAVDRMYEASLRAAVHDGSTTLPPRQAVDLGPCVKQGCPRTAVKLTPTHHLPVCDDHYGPNPRVRPAKAYCHCGEPALYAEGHDTYGLLCSLHAGESAALLNRLVNHQRRDAS